ncbi:lipocalin-like domain-containing protein [Balneola sp. MJW-20]|uniref:lipocalin-like domain-containing protein n=1 Tax=Gracilimonas aurantiaca TaxID=3234185 RepID=UPI00346643EE
MKKILSGIFSVLLLVSCTGGMNEQGSGPDGPSILGAWELEQSVWTDGDSTDVWKPYKSLYLYTDKYYSTEIVTAERPNLPESDEDRTAEVMAEAANVLISNAGRYEIVGDSLIYYVMVSKSPDRMNTNQRVAHHIRIEQDRVILTNSEGNTSVTRTLVRMK